MSVTSLRYLFTPELLDSRLVSDISDIPQNDGASKRDESSASTGKSAAKRTSPSRWTSIEYIVYIAAVAFIIPNMFMAAYQISKGVYKALDINDKDILYKY
ncbi:hypothetical protein ABW20_dc0109437 [Dactylellina cionopaga]|nr:hypothetical protein ABW20_dc0109437 [Dactylellina cionopaga]